MIRINSLHIIFTFLLAIPLAGCDGTKETKLSKSVKKDGILKSHWPDGSIKAEVSYKNGKKNGVAMSYYNTGQVRQEVKYINNIKHGEAKTYYESGLPYQITPYDNGKITGIRKKFRKNGKLMAEIPYHNNEPCRGLKEYLLNGKLKKMYPQLIITPIDRLLDDNEYILRLTLSDKSKNVEYYIGKLSNEGCMNEDLLRVEPQKPGILEVKYTLPKGSFIMEEVHFVVKLNTKLGNPYLIEKTYNLAIENRIY